MANCKKHGLPERPVDVEYGKTAMMCPKCQQERQVSMADAYAAMANFKMPN